VVKISDRIKAIGPAALIAAAFIGPGTVTTCTLAGAGFGYSLLWALLFSMIATMVLQEMSARLGLIGQIGLGDALRKEFKSPLGKLMSTLLVLSAIALGNAAYETGNILGGAMGMTSMTGIDKVNIGSLSFNIWGLLIGAIAFSLLYTGSYKVIEKGLIGLVVLMSITFISTAILVKPDISEIFKGMFIPGIKPGSTLTIVGLIGTTVVPYNLFLHASLVKQKWKDPSMIGVVRGDNLISIGAGGLISMTIVITAATAFYGTGATISGASDMADQLGPLLGRASSFFLSLGLLSAGISSAITAPLAAAYATSEILGWDSSMKSRKFRMVWIIVLLTGTIFSIIGFKPINAIFIAQITNGILLPFIAIFLLKVMNNEKLLGNMKNGILANSIGFLVILVALLLGIKSVVTVLGMI
jgi:manganese transport protein